MRNHRESGQAAIMITFGTLVMFGLLGLVVDVGWGYYRKQVAQAAADAAATAAAMAASTVATPVCGTGVIVCTTTTPITCPGTTGNVAYTACQYGLQNGIASANMKITANTTTFSGVTSAKYWITATVSEPLVPTFIRTLGFNSATVGASATAGVVSNGGGTATGCLYVMDPTVAQAFWIEASTLSSTCGIYVNSNNTTSAAYLDSVNATLSGTGSGTLNMVTGAVKKCNSCGCSNYTGYGGGASTTCMTAVTGTAATDPLSAVPAPTVPGTCDFTNYSWSNLTPAQTLNPGTYCGGMNLGGGTITLNAGTYILNGGGLTIQGGSNTTVTATAGVTFYNTATSGHTAGPLLVSSQVNLHWKAPASGVYQGIAFMQDRSVCPSSSHAINGQGSSNTIAINGTLYMHCTQTGGSYVAQKLLYSGQSVSGYYTAFVVDTFEINGATNMVLDPAFGGNTGIGLGSNKPYLIQ